MFPSNAEDERQITRKYTSSADCDKLLAMRQPFSHTFLGRTAVPRQAVLSPAANTTSVRSRCLSPYLCRETYSRAIILPAQGRQWTPPLAALGTCVSSIVYYATTTTNLANHCTPWPYAEQVHTTLLSPSCGLNTHSRSGNDLFCERRAFPRAVTHCTSLERNEECLPLDLASRLSHQCSGASTPDIGLKASEWILYTGKIAWLIVRSSGVVSVRPCQLLLQQHCEPCMTPGHPRE